MNELTSRAEALARLAAGAARHAAVLHTGWRTISGIVWEKDLCISAAEPLARARRIQIEADGTAAHSAELVALDLSTDVAVLRTQLAANPIPRADSGALRLGEPVLVAGRDARGALVHEAAVAQVGAAWQSRRGGQIERWLRLTQNVPPALEGAGVFDLQGRLLAMAVEGPRGAVLGIPVETIARILGLIERHGHLPQPYLGIAVQPVALAPGSADGGAQDRALMVLAVDAGSPASAAGLLAGDILLSEGSRPLGHPLHLVRALRAGAPGEQLEFKLLRAGEPRALTVTRGERPAAPARARCGH